MNPSHNGSGQQFSGSRKRPLKSIDIETGNEEQRSTGTGRIDRSMSRSDGSSTSSGSEDSIATIVADTESSAATPVNDTATGTTGPAKETNATATDKSAAKVADKGRVRNGETNSKLTSESSEELDAKIVQVEQIVNNLSADETTTRLVLLRSVLAELRERKAALSDTKLAAKLNERRTLSSGTLLSDISLAPFMAPQPLSNSFGVGAENKFEQRQTRTTATQVSTSESVPMPPTSSSSPPLPQVQQPPTSEFTSSLGATLRLLSIPPLGHDLQKFLRYSALVVVTLLLLAILTPRLFFICVTLMLLVFLVFLLSVLHGRIKAFKQKASDFIRDRFFGKANNTNINNDNNNNFDSTNRGNTSKGYNNYYNNDYRAARIDARNYEFPDNALTALLGQEPVITARKRKTSNVYSEMRDHIDAAKRALNEKNYNKSVDHITIAEAMMDGVMKDNEPSSVPSSPSPSFIHHRLHDGIRYSSAQQPVYASGTTTAPEVDMPINLERLQQLRKRFNLN